MTFEEMQEKANQVAETLNSSPAFSEAEVVTDDIKPGDPIPIAFTDTEGNQFGAKLDLI